MKEENKEKLKREITNIFKSFTNDRKLLKNARRDLNQVMKNYKISRKYKIKREILNYICGFIIGAFVGLGIISSIIFSRALLTQEVTLNEKLALFINCVFSFGCAGALCYKIIKEKKSK